MNEHRAELKRLENMVETAGDLPTDNQNNAEFSQSLSDLKDTAEELLQKGLSNQGAQ